MSNTRKLLPRGRPHIDAGAGCLIELPDSEDDVITWAADASADPRISDDAKDYVRLLASRMITAIRTGEGVIRR